MKKALAIIITLLIISGCETTREVERNNISSTTVKSKTESDKSKNAETRVGIGLTYINAQNYKRAKFHLDRAMEYDPRSSNVHYAFGIYFQRVKEYDKAEKHFKRALSIQSKRPEYLNAYGAFLCEKGEFKKADEMFQRAIAIPTYTDVASAFYNVGFCALKQNDVEKAAEYFRKSLNRDRHRADALIEMAKIEFAKERYDRTMQYVRRFEATGTTAESAWLGLRASHYLRDKDSIARYQLLLEQKFPDSEETAKYLDNKKRWM